MSDCKSLAVQPYLIPSMCLILIGNHVHPAYPLVIAANRDEYFQRPTQKAAFWDDYPSILAGRDLEKGGTWLGIDADGRVAAVTNYREPPGPAPGNLSRGFLVRDYLIGSGTAAEYLTDVSKKLDRYDGFNLFAGDQKSLFFLSTYVHKPRLLDPGIHGISNGELDYPWPKVILGKSRFGKLLQDPVEIDENKLFELMADRSVPDISSMPPSDLDQKTQRMVAPIFVHGDNYGTRSTTILLCDQNGRIRFIEKSFDKKGKPSDIVTFEFTLEKTGNRG